MSARPSNVNHLNGIQAQHGVLDRERENLGLFLHQLCNELADQHCEIDADQDAEYAYFNISLALALDDIDICVHRGHVLVRMARQQ